MRVTFNVTRYTGLVLAANIWCGCVGIVSENEGSDTASEETSKALALATAKSHPRGNARLRVLTFNSALAPGFEPLALERAPMVIEALARAAETVDLMCVQELWLSEHFDALKANTPALPHVLRMEPRPGTGNCAASELTTLVDCLAVACPAATGKQLAGCAQTACPSQVAGLSGGCLGCIMNHLDDLPACLGSGDGPSDPAVFGGTFDVGLFSRWPIQRASHRELSSYFVRVSVLHAQVQTPRFGEVDVYCTHLGSALGIVPYAGDYGSWEAEQARQIEELLQFIRSKHHRGRPVLLLGDFNTGPAMGNNLAVWPSNYQGILDAGFDDAYITGEDTLCTTCAGTTFRDAAASNEVIDHVFVRGFRHRRIKSERLFVEPVDLGSGLPEFNLSDHVGVKLTFE